MKRINLELAGVGKVGQPYEVIVENDASTDATGEIARRRGVGVGLRLRASAKLSARV
jgi:hypothetical protein